MGWMQGSGIARASDPKCESDHITTRLKIPSASSLPLVSPALPESIKGLQNLNAASTPHLALASTPLNQSHIPASLTPCSFAPGTLGMLLGLGEELPTLAKDPSSIVLQQSVQASLPPESLPRPPLPKA